MTLKLLSEWDETFYALLLKSFMIEAVPYLKSYSHLNKKQKTNNTTNSLIHKRRSLRRSIT